MALIKCPECGKEVSDKASTCIHCGYPLSESTQQRPQPQTVSQPVQSVYRPVASRGFYVYSAHDGNVHLECGKCETVIKLAGKYFSYMSSDKCISNTLIRCPHCANESPAGSTFIAKKKPVVVEKLKCPRCGSTLVTTGSRGVSFWTGLWGSNKTVNRCGKCGHTWEPRR